MKAKLYHVHGLPVPEGAECSVELTKNGVKIEAPDYEQVLTFPQIATFEFDGCDIVEEEGIVGIISPMAGGLVGRLEGKKFLEWVAPKDAKYPEEVTCLIVNYVDEECRIIRSVFVEHPDTAAEDSVIEMVFAFADAKPDRGEEYLKEHSKEFGMEERLGYK